MLCQLLDTSGVLRYVSRQILLGSYAATAVKYFQGVMLCQPQVLLGCYVVSVVRYFQGVTLCRSLGSSRVLCCFSRQVLLGCYVVSVVRQFQGVMLSVVKYFQGIMLRQPLGTARVLCCVSRQALVGCYVVPLGTTRVLCCDSRQVLLGCYAVSAVRYFPFCLYVNGEVIPEKLLHFQDSLALKRKALRAFETSATIYQSTWRNIPEGYILYV